MQFGWTINRFGDGGTWGVLAAGSRIMLPAGTMLRVLVADSAWTMSVRHLRLDRGSPIEPIGGDRHIWARRDGTYEFHGDTEFEFLEDAVLVNPVDGSTKNVMPGSRAHIDPSAQPWTIVRAATGTVLPSPAPPADYGVCPDGTPKSSPTDLCVGHQTPVGGETSSSSVPLLVGGAVLVGLVIFLASSGK